MQNLFFKTSLSSILVALVLVGLSSGCAPSQANLVTPAFTPTTTNTLTLTNTPTVATAPDTKTLTPPTNTPSAMPSPSETMPNPNSAATPSALSGQLVALLTLAANALRDAQTAATLAQAHSDAETAVNLLVGQYGRWYGDQDGDKKINAPMDKRGALPAEKIPASGGADGDAPVQFPYGLILLAAGRNPNTPPVQAMLGDVTLWRTQPRAGYDTIANAVANFKNDPQMATLQGNVPRAVAVARLILTNAQSVEEAHTLASSAVNFIDRAVQAAQAMP